jgi:Rrf2 family protein
LFAWSGALKISKKSDYALRVMFALVENYQKGPVSIRELAESNDIPKRFLEHILLDLKARGWVDSVPGKYGGYILAHDPSQINMGEVVRTFDPLLSPINCVSIHDYEPCTQEATCRFRRVFLEIRNNTARLMEHASLASVYAGEPVKKREVFDEAFIGGEGI